MSNKYYGKQNNILDKDRNDYNEKKENVKKHDPPPSFVKFYKYEE